MRLTKLDMYMLLFKMADTSADRKLQYIISPPFESRLIVEIKYVSPNNVAIPTQKTKLEISLK